MGQLLFPVTCSLFPRQERSFAAAQDDRGQYPLPLRASISRSKYPRETCTSQSRDAGNLPVTASMHVVFDVFFPTMLVCAHHTPWREKPAHDG